MVGRVLGHYRILEFLASGGMGEVYRARDEHLERDVAVKVLPPALVADDGARRRLRREAVLLSRLHHPHVAAVYDFDDQEGVVFLVMELVEGESLAQRLEGGPQTASETCRIGAEIASALSAAHAQGVLHGDLKPGNVLLDWANRVRVVDFGIARRIPTDHVPVLTTMTTEPHGPRGTVPYMAPEVLEGREADGRADLFSLGILLHETATGRLPFAGDSAITVAGSILHRAPEIDAQLPEPLQSVITQCLAKAPGERFRSAEEVQARLEHRTTSRLPLPRGRGRVLRWVGAATLSVALAVAAWRLYPRLAANPQAGAVDALAVLPLQNLSRDPEQEFFADGITEELIVRLSKVAALKVIANSSSSRFKGSTKPMREIARELDVDAVITGSIQRAGQRVRIRAEMVDARTGHAMWADSFERGAGDVLALQSDLAQAIVSRAQVALAPEEKVRLAQSRPVDPMAHEHYLRGRHYWHQFNTRSWALARVEFERAIDIDPTYAPAHVGLSDTYAVLSGFHLSTMEAMTRARAEAKTALELDPDLPEAHAAYGYVLANYDRDWGPAEQEYRRALALHPNELTALQNLGYLMHVHGRFAEALTVFRRARELDPLSIYVAGMTLWPLNQGRKYGEAIAAGRDLVAADTSSWYIRFLMGQALVHAGRKDEGIAQLEQALSREDVLIAKCWLGYAYGVAGRREDALRLLRAAFQEDEEKLNPYGFALVYAGLRDREQTLHWLEKGWEERTEEIHFMAVDPAMDYVREDPRFRVLLRDLGLDRVDPYRPWKIPPMPPPTEERRRPGSDRA